VAPFAVEATHLFLQDAGMTRIQMEEKDIGHAMAPADPISALKWVYNDLQIIATSDFVSPSNDPFADGTLTSFDQAEFVPSGWSFDQSTFRGTGGKVYVPHSCNSGQQCKVHVVFHGCGAPVDPFTFDMGYMEFGATNNIIMLFPDADCWGFNNSVDDINQLNKDGMMSKAIFHMIARVASGDYAEEDSKLNPSTPPNPPTNDCT
jgi:hypothetical protein